MDVVVIDTAPYLGLLTVNALVAAEKVLIPVSCEYLPMLGLKLLGDTLARLRDRAGAKAEVLGELGATVVDIDRVLAHIGGRGAQCDYRLGGRIAAEVAGYAVAHSLLSVGLDDAIPVDIQERAKLYLGELQQIDVLVNRRLNRQT